MNRTEAFIVPTPSKKMQLLNFLLFFQVSYSASNIIMFSSIARTAVQRAAVRTSANNFSAILSKQTPQTFALRHFSAATFLSPEEVAERIVQVVKNFDKVDPAKVHASSKFADDLGLDSLDAVEVVMAIEDEFAIEIPDAEADKIASVEDAVEYISSHPMAK